MEKDIIEKFIRSQGPGGQNVNKVSTCVYLKHIPTGLEVKCQQERTQAQNRILARRMLEQKVAAERARAAADERARVEKARRQRRKRSALAKARMLESKRRHSAKKSFRAKVRDTE